ncbi:DUF3236 domain-containing protein [Methanobacterium ferruginis]|uniref:DUF3236 domain-containing protein n=1 Tax=Methanobacterium ferruginis TaxID=710191 RepID=UPI0025738F79|nr:DUF3236 domain-containing protein [Methanobacterium ferruginis]BDZ68052.1 hypothetical protein GCM10025860_15000 [Methanobacterium ferruginis]
MNIEKTIKNAYQESVRDERFGDTEDELIALRNHIRSCKRIVVPNKNTVKTSAINEVLTEFNLPSADHLCIHTNSADLSRTPAITKALLALDICDCDLVIARGRLGVPGSGSLLVIMDKKGRILSAATSPSHIVHGKEVEEAVKDEITQALLRIGFTVVE